MCLSGAETMSEQTPIRCPRCSSTKVWKRGIQILSKKPLQRYQCKSCGYLFTETQLIFRLPNPVEVRRDFFRILGDLDSFITLVSTQESMKFEEFHHRLHLINMDIIRAWHQINLLTVTDKKYSKAFEKLRKILIKLVDLSDVERKHVKPFLISWEHEFREGKLRKDLVKFLKTIAKQMKKVRKDIKFY